MAKDILKDFIFLHHRILFFFLIATDSFTQGASLKRENW